MDCWKCSNLISGASPFCPVCGALNRVDNYEVLAPLGQGDSSSVFKCVDTTTGDLVVVKKFSMDPTSAVQAMREISVLESIQHPNIVRMIRSSIEGGFIVLEFIPGGSLADKLAEDPEAVRRNFTPWMVQACEGLRALHRLFICHRDLNPQNILVGDDGVVRIVDFGVSRVLQPGSRGRTIVGLLPYAAPEVVLSHPYDVRADIYSLGAVFYEIWTSHPPVEAPSYQSFRMKLAQRQIPTVVEENPNAPRAISDLVSSMLEYPERRVQSVEWILAELRGVEAAVRQGATIDDHQLMLARIYGHKNRSRTQLELLTHLYTNLVAAVDAIRSSDPAYRRQNCETYFPRAFAWLCAVVSSLNWRMSEVISLKYSRDTCPYCNEAECVRCESRAIVVDRDLNTSLLQAFDINDIGQQNPKTIRAYQAHFQKIYGSKNQRVGVSDVCLHLLSEVGEVMDDLHRLEALEESDRLSILHFEVSDLTAWFFALVNLYGDGYDLEAKLRSTFPGTCYRCSSEICGCDPKDAEIRRVDWG